MAEERKSPFRITVWPDSPLPLPPRWFTRPYEVNNGTLQPTGVEQELKGDKRHDDETYLELYELDLDDVNPIVQFVSDYGVLGVSYKGFSLMPHALYPVEMKELEVAKQAAHAEQRLESDLAIPNQETLTEFRYGARTVRRLADAWRRYESSDDDPAAFEDGALLERWLSAALTPFHPVVALEGGYDGPSSEEVGLWGAIPLYSVCCLQLFNHMARGLIWRRCANETCRRPFVRQEGRAEHGQHRSVGVKYHTAYCARAQAQRDYRRRRAGRSTTP